MFIFPDRPPMPSSSSSHPLALFIDAIAQRLGIAVREKDYGLLGERLQLRQRERHLNSLEDYYQLLTQPGPLQEEEWSALVCLITNLESYFFRDRGQFELLRRDILPDLIARRRGDRRLKIWSAGCSTGEEPHSLAMLLQEVLPDWPQWHIQILASDINPEALATARKGVYTHWSFRSLDAPLKDRYFSPLAQGYQVIPEVRRLLTFFPLNLVHDPFPPAIGEPHHVDLILCRNVFIYFDNLAIAQVLQKFAATLQPWGYLLTGHAELYGQDLKAFQVRVFPESVVYQPQMVQGDLVSAISPSLPQPPVSSPKIAPKIPSKIPPRGAIAQRPTLNLAALIQENQNLIRKKYYPQAIGNLEKALPHFPKSAQLHSLLAQVYANIGRYDEALEYCQKTLKIDPFAVNIYYLMAQVAEEQSNVEEAKRCLKQILYLDPRSVKAYLELAYIYQQEGDGNRAIKMRENAIALLEKLPPQQCIDDGAFTVEEYLNQLRP